MIPWIGQANNDLGINCMSNILKNISDMQCVLIEKLTKVRVTDLNNFGG
jgi:hypothetical protein